MDATNLNCNSNDSGCSKTEETTSPQEKILSSGIQLRTSARVSKKLRLDQEAALAAVNGSKKDEVKEDLAVGEKRRVRRARVLWSPEEQAAFFEALNEHGKNFYAIEKYMATRAKRRGEHSSKDRRMARHFYTRSWHKLSKYVHFPESINKVTQELYALINFGELRKKVGHVTEKNAQRLNELIYSGSTQVRVKGKSWRVKTPVCRALRKLNHFEDDREEIRLPNRVEVLLTARTNKDAVRVQSVGHNPRVRTCLSLDTNTDYLVSVLSRRWAATTSNVQEVLRVGPKKNAIPTQTTYTVGLVVTSSSVSLQSYEKRIGTAASQVKDLLSQLQVGKTKSALKWQREGCGPDELLDSPVVDPSQIDDAAQLPDNPLIPTQMLQQQQQSQPTTGNNQQQTSTSSNQEMTLAIATRIGHLYLMYGSKGVLELEYWWDKIKTEGPQPSGEKQNFEVDFTKALSKLVSIAKLFHYKTKVECPCGHICRGSMKLSTGVQSKASKQKQMPKQKVENSPVVTVAAAPSLVTIENPQVISVSPPVPPVNTVRIGFKQPLLPAPLRSNSTDPGTAAVDLRSALHQFRPKYCSRRGRARQRSVVVQRMLPLLPKSKQVIVAVQVLPSQNQQPPSASSVSSVSGTTSTTSLNVAAGLSPLQPTAATISAVPSSSAENPSATTVTASPASTAQLSLTSNQLSIEDINNKVGDAVKPTGNPVEVQQSQLAVGQNLPKQGVSSESLLPQMHAAAVAANSNLCQTISEKQQQITVPAHLICNDDVSTASLTGLLNLPLSESTKQPSVDDISFTSAFKGIIGFESNSGEPMDETPPTSPSRLLKEGEGQQWLSPDVAEFSLSSFLGHLESPMKSNGASEDTHMSTDVESHFQSLLAENSLDYTAKFADLAAKIVGSNQPAASNVSVPPS